LRCPLRGLSGRSNRPKRMWAVQNEQKAARSGDHLFVGLTGFEPATP
jgi:hypothetical protein